MGLIFLSCLCGTIFVVAGGLRIFRQMRLPLHLRWELYPVQHEPERSRIYYGGLAELIVNAMTGMKKPMIRFEEN